MASSGEKLTGPSGLAADAELRETAQSLAQHDWRCLLCVGRPDTGKSTLTLAVAAAVLRRLQKPVALLQTDPGQAHLGPPSAIAWGTVEGATNDNLSWGEVELRGMSFVASTSPYGHLLEMLAGTAWCWRAARAASDRLIVDTSGLATGPLGTLLKTSKIDLMLPDIVVLLEKEPGELEPLSRWLHARRGIRTEVLRASTGVMRRTPADRKALRSRRWQAYFATAGKARLNPNLVGADSLPAFPPRTVIAARSASGETLGLALLLQPEELEVLAPWSARSAAIVIPGTFRLNDSFEEERLGS